MKLLLDTHVFLWLSVPPPLHPPAVKSLRPDD